jgi:hypothetical protein
MVVIDIVIGRMAMANVAVLARGYTRPPDVIAGRRGLGWL